MKGQFPRKKKIKIARAMSMGDKSPSKYGASHHNKAGKKKAKLGYRRGKRVKM